MTSLDHWNFADQFTGAEAACLILGIDPKNPNAETYKGALVLPRLKAAYALAVEHDDSSTWQEIFYPKVIDEHKEASDLVSPLADQVKPTPPTLNKNLTSKQVIEMIHARASANEHLPKMDGIWLDTYWPSDCLDAMALQSSAIVALRAKIFLDDTTMDYFDEPNIEGLTPADWLASEKSKFENQTFSRQELHRWLEVIDLESVYGFEPSSLAVSSPSETPASNMTSIPWPAHDTKNLLALRSAALIWEQSYKKGDDTTAPTNEAIAQYLRNEHGIAPTLADAMATIVRADGLRTGPRTGPKKGLFPKKATGS